MPHPLVDQLRFARSEFRRGLARLSDKDARKRNGPMNSISWMIGHLAWQEQRYWLTRAQGKTPIPELNKTHAYGKPATTPPLKDAWAAWRRITKGADPWLDELGSERVNAPLAEGLSSVGTFLLRTTYHYWYHLGEGLAARQVMGHMKLPDFVGDIDGKAPYREV